MASKKKKPKPSAPKKVPKRSPPPSAPVSAPALEHAAEEITSPRPGTPFPVVGIAASAGGLDAFKKFFAAMPAESGAAFVCIPHLDPTHRSLMAELMARHTTMPVVEAKDKQRVQPNHVYIIPPNKYMTIANAALNLTGPVERGTASTPIDLFLRSLADDAQERAVCVIFSGTGAHGSLGLKAIKAAGGMAMVQDPKTAEYDRMPYNAVATGGADVVLPPEELPAALVNYLRHSYVNGARRLAVTGDGQAAVEEASENRIDGGGVAVVDITDRKLLEEQGQRLNEELERRIQERTAELRDSEQMMRSILAAAAEAMVVIDEKGIVHTFNKAAERMFGYQAHEVVGSDVTMLAAASMRQLFETGFWRHATVASDRRETEGRRKDGSTFPMELAISETRVGGRRIFPGVVRDISQRRELEREIVGIAANEQRRIGQDLHDGVGQELTGLALLARNLLEEVKTACPDEVELSEKIVAGLKRVLGQVRALSQGLLPVEVDSEGLMNALQGLAGRISDQAGIKCTFTCDQPVQMEDNTVATHLYRIAQEAVANALTHGKAKKIDIGLNASSGFLRLTIEDDGRGIQLPVKSDGLGLKLMQYRANLIGANCQVESGDGRGTLVTCVLYRGEEK